MVIYKGMRLLYLSLGVLFTLLGMIGLALPLMPTTPFLIVAAFCFSKSSPRLHQWLLDLKAVGPALRDWEEGGVIRTKPKIFATIMIIVMVSYPVYKFRAVYWISGSILVTITLVLLFIWTRPSLIIR